MKGNPGKQQAKTSTSYSLPYNSTHMHFHCPYNCSNLKCENKFGNFENILHCFLAEFKLVYFTKLQWKHLSHRTSHVISDPIINNLNVTGGKKEVVDDGAECFQRLITYHLFHLGNCVFYIYLQSINKVLLIFATKTKPEIQSIVMLRYLPVVGHSTEKLQLQVKPAWIFVEQPPETAGQILHDETAICLPLLTLHL